MALEDRLSEALAFTAPYVVDRLITDRVCDSRDEAQRLFTEAKRYLVLCEASPGTAYGMYSSMVDSAWHTFILFTAEYTDYSQRYFGSYLHHVPAGSATVSARTAESQVASFNEFRLRYEELFGEPLPVLWYDETSVVPSRRVVNDTAGHWTVTADGDVVGLADATGEVVLSVNALALPALTFIAETADFYVRELPGELTDEEKVGLIAPLVRSGILRTVP